MSPHRSKRDYLKLCAYALACIVLVALALGTRDTRHEVDRFGAQVDQLGTTIDELQTFSTASRTSRIEFQARETFLLCSRDLVKTVIPERRADVAAACEGYGTMADALRTERAKQKTATG